MHCERMEYPFQKIVRMTASEHKNGIRALGAMHYALPTIILYV